MSAGGPAYKQMAPLGGSGDVAWPGNGLWRRVGRTMFRTKSVEEALADRDDDGKSLKKCLNLYELVLFGLGWMMGAGIFVLTGVAASLKAGPAIVLSYAFAGVVCVFSAFSYAEFAARIPLSGSAYTYAYTTVGEFPAWIIGWDLTLEYMIGSAAVARGWSGYVRGMLTGVGIDYPLYLTHWQVGPCDVDITAALAVVVLTIVICFGIKESSHFNGLIVGTTVFSILFIIILGAFYADPDNWEPFMPYGVSGIFSGSALIFFAYIGFDSISAAAEECNNPQRDLPIGIMACLAIAGVLYSGVAAVITLMVKYDEIDLESPLSSAFAARGLGWAQVIISIGAFAALTSSILGGLLYLPRIYFTMARDGLMWPIFSYIHPKTHTPLPASIVTGTMATVLTLLVKIEVLADMVSIGSLFAMLMVCACVLTTRYEQPNGSITPVMMVLGLVTTSAVCFMLFVRDHPYSAAIFGLLAILPIAYFFKTKQTFVPETFKCPLVPLTPILGILSNIYLMANLTAATWWRLFGWLALGLCIYLGYGIRNSRLAKRQNQYNEI